jgi:hypothetical protein
MADLLLVHRRGPAESLAAGAGGVQAFAGALDDELADELGEGGEDVEDQAAAGRASGKDRFRTAERARPWRLLM